MTNYYKELYDTLRVNAPGADILEKVVPLLVDATTEEELIAVLATQRVNVVGLDFAENAWDPTTYAGHMSTIGIAFALSYLGDYDTASRHFTHVIEGFNSAMTLPRVALVMDVLYTLKTGVYTLDQLWDMYKTMSVVPDPNRKVSLLASASVEADLDARDHHSFNHSGYADPVNDDVFDVIPGFFTKNPTISMSLDAHAGRNAGVSSSVTVDTSSLMGAYIPYSDYVGTHVYSVDDLLAGLVSVTATQFIQDVIVPLFIANGRWTGYMIEHRDSRHVDDSTYWAAYQHYSLSVSTSARYHDGVSDDVVATWSDSASEAAAAFGTTAYVYGTAGGGLVVDHPYFKIAKPTVIPDPVGPLVPDNEGVFRLKPAVTIDGEELLSAQTSFDTSYTTFIDLIGTVLTDTTVLAADVVVDLAGLIGHILASTARFVSKTVGVVGSDMSVLMSESDVNDGLSHLPTDVLDALTAPFRYGEFMSTLTDSHGSGGAGAAFLAGVVSDIVTGLANFVGYVVENGLDLVWDVLSNMVGAARAAGDAISGAVKWFISPPVATGTITFVPGVVPFDSMAYDVTNIVISSLGQDVADGWLSYKPNTPMVASIGGVLTMLVYDSKMYVTLDGNPPVFGDNGYTIPMTLAEVQANVNYKLSQVVNGVSVVYHDNFRIPLLQVHAVLQGASYGIAGTIPLAGKAVQAGIAAEFGVMLIAQALMYDNSVWSHGHVVDGPVDQLFGWMTRQIGSSEPSVLTAIDAFNSVTGAMPSLRVHYQADSIVPIITKEIGQFSAMTGSIWLLKYGISRVMKRLSTELYYDRYVNSEVTGSVKRDGGDTRELVKQATAGVVSEDAIALTTATGVIVKSLKETEQSIITAYDSSRNTPV